MPECLRSSGLIKVICKSNITYFDVRMGFQDLYVVEKVDTYVALDGDDLEVLEDFPLTFL
jgi:hypothetical protein